MQAEPLGRQMFSNDRHREIRAVLAAVLLGQREAVMARPVGPPAHLAQQRLPLVTRQAAPLEVRARPFAAMIEEANIVVFAFERFDLALDKFVELAQISFDISRDVEIHERPLLRAACQVEGYAMLAMNGTTPSCITHRRLGPQHDKA